MEDRYKELFANKTTLWAVELACRFLNSGYYPHLDSWLHGGLLLKAPKVDSIQGEVKETIPMALEYTQRGHLVVLLAPEVDEAGRGILSPDGFLDEEHVLIEFKNVTKAKEYTLDNQLKDAAKRGKAVIRSIKVPNHMSPDFLARRLNGRYNASAHMDRVHVIYKSNILKFSRLIWEEKGYNGILNIIKKGETSFEDLA